MIRYAIRGRAADRWARRYLGRVGVTLVFGKGYVNARQAAGEPVAAPVRICRRLALSHVATFQSPATTTVAGDRQPTIVCDVGMT